MYLIYYINNIYNYIFKIYIQSAYYTTSLVSTLNLN